MIRDGESDGVLKLTDEIGVWVNLATSSWMYPIPRTFPRGDPKAESYQKLRSRLDGVSGDVKQRIRSRSLRVIKSFPFFNGEELTELGISESNSLAPSLADEWFP